MACLEFFRILKFQKEKKDMLKFQFFLILVKSGQTTYSRSINVTT